MRRGTARVARRSERREHLPRPDDPLRTAARLPRRAPLAADNFWLLREILEPPRWWTLPARARALRVANPPEAKLRRILAGRRGHLRRARRILGRL
jgi:hypothetical protein